jgi:hypothetical protein
MPVLSQSGEGVSVSRVESGSFQNRPRPILPCHRAAFKELVGWVERRDAPPTSKYVDRPKKGGVVNRCVLGKEARYVAR